MHTPPSLSSTSDHEIQDVRRVLASRSISNRLRACIRSAFFDGVTVDDLAQPDQRLAFLRSVPSASVELVLEIEAVLGYEPLAPDGMALARLRADLAMASLRSLETPVARPGDDLLVREAIVGKPVSIRLGNCLKDHRFDHLTVGDLRAPRRRARLSAEVPNMGRRTILELSDLLRLDDPSSAATVAVTAARRLSVEEVLGLLTDRQAAVLRRRYGFEGPVETLDPIAADLGVSGERVRQIQAEAIARLGGHHHLAMQGHLETSKDLLWNLLNDRGSEHLTIQRLIDHRHALPAIDMVVIDAVHGSVERWLDTAFARVPGGWSRHSEDGRWHAMLGSIITAIKEIGLPARIATVAEVTGTTPETVRAMLSSDATHSVLGDRVYPALRQEKLQRIDRLHGRMLDSIEAGRVDDLRNLMVEGDQGGVVTLTNDAGSLPNLFLNLFDHFWVPMDAIGSLAGASLRHPRVNREASFTANGIARIIHDAMKAHGPIAYAAFPKLFPDLPDRSIRGIINQEPRFFRVLPGVWGLAEHLDPKVLRDHVETSVKQSHLALQAQSGGGHRSLFVGWAGLPTIDDRAVPLSPLGMTSALSSVAPNRLLAMLIFARMTGGLGWIDVNRLRHVPPDSAKGRTILRSLIGLGFFSRATAPDGRQAPSSGMDEGIRLIAEHVRATGGREWSDDLKSAVLGLAVMQSACPRATAAAASPHRSDKVFRLAA